MFGLREVKYEGQKQLLLFKLVMDVCRNALPWAVPSLLVYCAAR